MAGRVGLFGRKVGGGALAQESFDQSLGKELAELYLSIAMEQDEDCPIAAESPSGTQQIIANNKNAGFAVFDDQQILEDTEPGEYPV